MIFYALSSARPDGGVEIDHKGEGFKGRMWNLIVSVPDHCLSFYFSTPPKGAGGVNVSKRHI